MGVVQPTDVDKILGRVHHAHLTLVFSGYFKAAKACLTNWLVPILNAFFVMGTLLTTLKQAVIQRFLKLSLDLVFSPALAISNLPFLSKVLKGFQVQPDYLDPFQSNFRLGFGIEITLVDDIRRDLDFVCACACAHPF